MSRKKKGQSSALTTCSKFYMQAMFEVISIVVFLFISSEISAVKLRRLNPICGFSVVIMTVILMLLFAYLEMKRPMINS